MVRIQLKFIDDAVVLVNAFQNRVVNDGGVLRHLIAVQVL
jgi:hypothetical protein